MGQPSRSHEETARLVDWLKDLDRRARKLPRADGWWTYPLFLFARYPRLRPPRTARVKRLDEALAKSGSETLAHTVLQWEKRIAVKAEGAAKGITREHLIQLAALVADIDAEFENFANRRQARSWAQKLAKEAPRRRGMLARKLAAARCSLEDLIQYANGLDPTLGGSYRKAAEGALEALATIPNGSSENLYQRLYGELREITEDPTTFSMVQLYWFFRSGCGLTGDESEVRVAIIRNELWIRSEVSKVDFIPAYQGDQSQGCQAVHEAVRRFRP